MTLTNVQRTRMLYKTILKLHRGLPPQLKELGTNYARDEFKRHKNCSPHEADIFLNEWSAYALSIAEQLGLRGPHTGTKDLGAPLTETDLANFRDEQIHQLYELMRVSVKDLQNN